MKRLIMVVLAMALFTAACGEDDPVAAEPSAAEPTESEPTATESEVTDDAPERIVSLSPTATEILFAIGAGDQVVAVDVYSNHPAEAPASGLDGFVPNVEAIAAFDPQLVVMQSNAASVEIEALGIEVVVQDSPATFDDMYAQIEQLGVATGHVADAAALVLEMQTEFAELQASAPDAGGLTYYHELGTDLYSLNSDSFIAQVYGLFGLTSIADEADGDAFAGYLQLSEEFVLDADPDLIFLADTIFGEQTVATVAARPGWGELSAVRNDAVIELDDDVASRWGPRLVEFAAQVADALRSVAVAS